MRGFTLIRRKGYCRSCKAAKMKKVNQWVCFFTKQRIGHTIANVGKAKIKPTETFKGVGRLLDKVAKSRKRKFRKGKCQLSTTQMF